MDPFVRPPAAVDPRCPDPGVGLDEAMWQLRLSAGGGGGLYPERPGETDCSYYMRTGSCGFGERCRFNHPRDRSVLVAGGASGGASEYPERAGHPACQYFLKTGTCKYGSTCKYDHPRQGDGSARQVTMNYFGYPLRPGEKECTYYLRTGQCKFGQTCKFNHPHLAGASAPSPLQAFYPSVQSPSVASPQQYQTIDVPRPSMLATPYIQGPYGPMLVSPGVVPVPGWSPYPVGIEFSTSASPVVSPGGQQSVQTGSVYGSSNQLSPSAPAYHGMYAALSSSSGISSRSQKEHIFPERPGQPECQYYMRTGDCKFGSTCKYHHPPERSIQQENCVLSPIGLPIRPKHRDSRINTRNKMNSLILAGAPSNFCEEVGAGKTGLGGPVCAESEPEMQVASDSVGLIKVPSTESVYKYGLRAGHSSLLTNDFGNCFPDSGRESSLTSSVGVGSSRDVISPGCILKEDFHRGPNWKDQFLLKLSEGSLDFVEKNAEPEIANPVHIWNWKGNQKMFQDKRKVPVNHIKGKIRGA